MVLPPLQRPRVLGWKVPSFQRQLRTNSVLHSSKVGLCLSWLATYYKCHTLSEAGKIILQTLTLPDECVCASLVLPSSLLC